MPQLYVVRANHVPNLVRVFGGIAFCLLCGRFATERNNPAAWRSSVFLKPPAGVGIDYGADDAYRQPNTPHERQTLSGPQSVGTEQCRANRNVEHQPPHEPAQRSFVVFFAFGSPHRVVSGNQSRAVSRQKHASQHGECGRNQ